MRRRGHGLLLPGVALTVLALVGVFVMFSAGMPALPEHVPGFAVRAQNDRSGSIHVPASRTPSAPPSPSSSARPPATRSPSATPSPARTRAASPPPATSRPATPPPTRPSTRPPSQPAPPSCTPGSAVLAAVADAYVDQSSPSHSYGSSPNLFVASRDKERNRRGLVRFALPSIPAGCSLRGATLTLTAKEATGRRLVVARASRAWHEGRVTWATAPGTTGTAVGATVSGPRVQWVVTDLVRAGAANGFVLRDAAENGSRETVQANFSSRDGRNPPTLTLRWS